MDSGDDLFTIRAIIEQFKSLTEIGLSLRFESISEISVGGIVGNSLSSVGLSLVNDASTVLFPEGLGLFASLEDITVGIIQPAVGDEDVVAVFGSG